MLASSDIISRKGDENAALVYGVNEARPHQSSWEADGMTVIVIKTISVVRAHSHEAIEFRGTAVQEEIDLVAARGESRGWNQEGHGVDRLKPENSLSRKNYTSSNHTDTR